EAPTTLSAVPLGLVPIQMKPGVETPGYSHKSLRDSRKEFNSVRVISLKLALMGRCPELRYCAPLGLCKFNRPLFGRAPRRDDFPIAHFSSGPVLLTGKHGGNGPHRSSSQETTLLSASAEASFFQKSGPIQPPS